MILVNELIIYELFNINDIPNEFGIRITHTYMDLFIRPKMKFEQDSLFDVYLKDKQTKTSSKPKNVASSIE
ncbi:hypothetical protein CR513_37174, partial [Mucuna pruriens]